MLHLIMGIVGYLLIGLILVSVCIAFDYARYKKTGYTDSKFPITSFNTKKMYVCMSPLWLPIAFTIVIGFCKNKF